MVTADGPRGVAAEAGGELPNVEAGGELDPLCREGVGWVGPAAAACLEPRLLNESDFLIRSVRDGFGGVACIW